ncbi:putative ABC transporter permease subunit [Undibacterium sp. Tian12W]|uniref:putative ABC transporter permease subunit n=1 Tax=Undibacterium sp. Tian12W TaxID=3413054 RepID=UPI003BF3033C
MARVLQFKPGSAAWLLAHECRLAYYDMGENKPGRKAARGMTAFSICFLGFMYLSAHFGVWLLMRKMPVLQDALPAPMLIGAGLAMLVIFSFMLSLGLTRSVRALFERGDLDLLLSSPLSSQTIFKVRLTGIIFSVGIWFFALLTPVANTGLILGQWRWLGIYPALFAMAVLAAALSMLLTLALVKSLGVRKTKTVAQILGALTGAGMFIITQLFGNLGKDMREGMLQHIMPWFQPGGMLDADSIVWTPAKAFFGSPGAIAGFLLFSALIYWLTAQSTHKFFITGVQQAVGQVRKAVPQGREQGRAGHATHFGRSLRSTIILKEWRLIARDPNLISQVLLQLLYIAPLFFLIFKSKALLPGAASGLVFLAASLAGSLIWIIIAAEDAPDLLQAAPVKGSFILSSKLLAAVLPILILILPALLWLLMQQFLLGLAVIACTLAAMLSSALIHLWQSKPASRAQFNKRGQTQLMANLLEAATSFSWAACIFVGMQYGIWVFAPIAVATLALGVAWFSRIERNL